MAVTKTKSEIIVDKSSVQMKTPTGGGSYATVGWVMGDGQIKITPIEVDLEDGSHQIGVKVEGSFNCAQFKDATVTELATYVNPAKVDIQFVGLNGTITVPNVHFHYGVDAKFNMKDALVFPCTFSGFAQSVDAAINTW